MEIKKDSEAAGGRSRERARECARARERERRARGIETCRVDEMRSMREREREKEWRLGQWRPVG